MIHYKKILKLLTLCLFLIAMTTGCERHNRAEVKTKKIDDIEIAYYTRGNGEPLVMIMGFRGTMAMWDPAVLNELEKKYTLILFDNRGAGLSTDTEKDLTTIPQMAEDTVRFIQALGYQKVHLLGWSMGSRIGLQIAISHPEVLKTLILCSPNPGGKYQVQRKNTSYEKMTALNPSEKEILSLIYPDTSEGRLASSDFILRLTEAIGNGSAPYDIKITKQTIERQVHALQLWDQNNNLYEELTKIKVPTLVASGLADVLDAPENARVVACRIPFAWSAYFPEAGHAFLSQDYKQSTDLINIFIDSQGHR